MNAFIKYEKQPLTYQAMKIKAKQLPFFGEKHRWQGDKKMPLNFQTWSQEERLQGFQNEKNMKNYEHYRSSSSLPKLTLLGMPHASAMGLKSQYIIMLNSKRKNSSLAYNISLMSKIAMIEKDKNPI